MVSAKVLAQQVIAQLHLKFFALTESICNVLEQTIWSLPRF